MCKITYTSSVIIFCLMFVFSPCRSLSQHTIILKSNEKIKGILMGVQYDTVSFVVNRRIQKIPLIEVSSMFFDEFVPYDGSMLENTVVNTVHSGNFQVDYAVKDREMTTVPVVSLGVDDHGIVVVEIVVNKNGNVTQAKSGGNGSTTSSEYLYTKAEFAARGARFDPSKIGPVETKGWIKIHY